MIFKSRNGIGIRVMLITLFFFFMLTDAEPNQTVKKFEGNCGSLNVTMYFPEMNEKEEVTELNKYAIKAIETKIGIQKCWKNFYLICAFFSFVIIALWFIVYFKNKVEHWIKPNKSQTWILEKLHHIPKVGAYFLLVFCVVSLLVCLRKGRNFGNSTVACKILIKDIEYYGAKRIREILTIEEEKEQIKVDEEIVKIKEEIAKTDEEIVETDEEIVESNYDAPLPEAPSTVAPPLSEKPKASSVTIEATTKNPPSKKNPKHQSKKYRNNIIDLKSKDKKEGDQEDYHYFIYAIVFVFALFFICTLCNFEEEKEGEIYDV